MQGACPSPPGSTYTQQYTTLSVIAARHLFPELLAEAIDHQFRQPFLVNASMLSYNNVMWNTTFPDLIKKKNYKSPINTFLAIVSLLVKKWQTSDHFHCILLLLFSPIFLFNSPILKFSLAILKTLFLSRFFLAWSNMFKSNSWTQKAFDGLKPKLATTPPSIIYTNIFPLT